MIVLGPHVLVHHLLDREDDCDNEGDNEGDNDDHDRDNTNINSPRTGSISEQHDSADDYNNNVSSDECHGADSSPPPRRERTVQIHVDEASMQCWREARLQISMALGSIGAPPLTTPTNHHRNHEKDTAGNPNDKKIDNRSLQANLDCLTDMANAHVQLLQTIHVAMETLRVGTSVRLGLGPGSGCGRPVVRAEKAWLARRRPRHPQQQRHQQRRQQQSPRGSVASATSVYGDDGWDPRPRLTMQKSRDILHNAMVHQAISLRTVLLLEAATTIANAEEEGCPSSTNADDWNEFALDLRHSLQRSSGVVLTLSQLAAWSNRLGEFLSFVLSERLSRLPHPPTSLSDSDNDDDDDYGSIFAADARHSSQVAREQTAFLRSAFPSSGTGDDWNRDVTAGKKCRRERRRAEEEIERLKATLEAARVSLWAFENSYSNVVEDDDDDDTDADTDADKCSVEGDDADIPDDTDSVDIWWREFRDSMERCNVSIPEFEERFLSTTADGEDGEGETSAKKAHGANSDPSNADDARDRRISEHVSDAIVVPNGENPPTDGAQIDSADDPSLLADKTLVFSGRGARKPRPPSGKRIAASSSSSDRGRSSSLPPPPSSYRAADQTVLMRDLMKRIETMGMAEEHEVVVVDGESGTEDLDRGEVSGRGARNASSSTSSNRGGDRTREDKNQPFFLGVSGSLLAELTSTMASRPSCDGISEG